MIKITNGSITLTVPNSAYRGFYSASGFHPLADQDRIVPVTDEIADPEVQDEDINLSEIPISEMDFYQLCDYADQLGIDRRGIRSKKELRAVIRSNL